MTMDMMKALRQAALLRNLIEGCLKGTLDPMTGREIADFSSIKEQIGIGIAGYGRLSTQLQQMVKKKMIEKIGNGLNTTYRWVRTDDKLEVTAPTAVAAPAPAPVPEPVVPAYAPTLPELHIKIDNAKHAIKFEFGGMAISIEIIR